MVGYKGQYTTPVINGDIKIGSMIAVTGPNGIGKSILLKTLAGLLPPTSGTVEFTKNKPSISYLPQQKNIDCHFPITVFDVVSMGCWPQVNFFKKLSDQKKNLVWNALKITNLLNMLHYRISDLSGGQIQRMLFARVLVQQSSLILLDEPFQCIDQITCKTLIHVISKLCKTGCTIIAVLHDYKFISKYFSHVLSINQFSSIWQ